MNYQCEQLFFESNNSFYIYKLYKGDSIVFKNSLPYNPSFIVFYGTVYIMKIFTNGESIFLVLLTSNSLLNFNSSNSNYAYYKVIALENTYLIKLYKLNSVNHLMYFSNVINLLDLFYYTLKQYESSYYILLHKSIKYRIIQLLLLLCREFGILNSNYIIIPFEISQKTLSHITGSNPTTVNKIINDLIRKLLIKYVVKKKILICYFSFFQYLDKFR
uniref:global nitrogen transcriptional regulator n=1 Tax=Gracilaria urvillei TaxID=172974 RepID=UPI001D112C33|nr:global nitrogen transcriptional regulator [Hydropuntia urvillei]UAD88521.1 global nitrogen transcriptional regulator [Hydropuntia urvillei]